MDLNHDFLQSFFPLTRSFFLTGGNALNYYYLKHRLSEDLDCFTPDRLEFDQLHSMLSEVCMRINATCKEERTFPNFKRYLLSRHEEKTIVDFVYDPVRQLYPEKKIVQGVRVDVPEEMTANKLCALLGRAEYKDLIDLYFLQKIGFPALDYMSQAEKKDGGINNAALAYVLDQMDLSKMPDFLKKVAPIAELESFRVNLRDQLLKSALPNI